MIRNRAMLAVLGWICIGASAAPANDLRDLETQFDADISANDQLAWLRQLSAAPNHVGSAHNRANAEFILASFRSWGWDAHIETFQVLYPTPIATHVEMIAPDRVRLGGQEVPIPQDPSSANLAGALPPYVAYQGDGDVTADLVYVNYGMPADYLALARRGIDVRGRIVIARYGGDYRGLKPRLAQEHGAVGCIIYSDPADDGFAQGDVYPKGGARPPEGVQRGSVLDILISPGDPLTPGIGATEGATRLPRDRAPTILKIPTLPISYGDAAILLRRLDGTVAPAGWRGALPFTYHLGGTGAVRVRLAVKSDWAIRPIYNVIATLKGKRYPDRWIIRGNHHDGWVFGANDPLSGTVAMLSEARALGSLVRRGWRPDRTIVYASWDGEEAGLLGSTEWAETHEAELKRKALLYINTDGNARGFLEAQGSHAFQHLVNQAIRDVPDPQTGVSVFERARANILAGAYDGTAQYDASTLEAAEKGEDLPIGALGSGSDYSAMLQHLGIPAINMEFTGEDAADGAAHSIYDSFDHVTAFEDPGLEYGAALSKVVGRIVLRMAQSDTPSQRFDDFAETMERYLAEIESLEEGQRAQDERRERLIASGAFRLAADPKRPVTDPPNATATPYLELAVLRNAVENLRRSAAAYDAAYIARGAALTPERRAQLNDLLADIDQLLLDDRGLPGRPWYRNLIYAPGRYTGYGAKTMPGVREAIEERRFADANANAVRVADALDAYAARLDRARLVLSPTNGR